MAENAPIILKTIGVINNAVEKAAPGEDWWSDLMSEIVVERKLAEALDGLEDFSHIIVLFWIDRPERTELRLKMHPMGRVEIPLTGMFATRTPYRPNRIGLTVVQLLERNGNVLKVKGLDALNGSPLVDIKPYIPIADLMPDAKVPEWIPQ